MQRFVNELDKGKIMKMQIKQIEKQIYVAKDNKEFDDPRDCASYEWEQFDAIKVYMTTRLRKLSNEESEIYSSEEKAQQAINSYINPEDWKIKTIFLNERIEKLQILEKLKNIV